MIWERQQRANLEGLLLRARHVRATGALTCVLTTHKNSRKSIWSQTVPHVTPNSYVKITWAVKLAIIVREYFAPRRKNMGHITCAQRWYRFRWNVDNFQGCRVKFLE